MFNGRVLSTAVTLQDYLLTATRPLQPVESRCTNDRYGIVTAIDAGIISNGRFLQRDYVFSTQYVHSIYSEADIQRLSSGYEGSP